MIESPPPTIVDVAIPLPLDSTYHYAVPQEFASLAVTGARVLVPFGRRKLTGYVLGAAATSGEELKEIVAILDPEPLFTPAELEFFRWAAGYYVHPLGEVIKAALPAGINITSTRKAADGTELAEESLRGGQRVKMETYYQAAAVPEGKALREKPARILAFLQEKGEAPAGCCAGSFLPTRRF